MNAVTWQTTDDVRAMLRWLRSGERGYERRHGKSSFGPVSDRKLRLFAVACARMVWHLLGDDVPCPGCLGKGGDRGCAPYPRDAQGRTWRHAVCPDCHGTGRINRSRRAVEVAELFADWEATQADADRAVYAFTDRLSRCGDSPEGYAMAAASNCCWQTVADGARAAAYNLRLAGQPAATQAALLREMVGNPFRKGVMFSDVSEMRPRSRQRNTPMSAVVARVGEGGGKAQPPPYLTPTVLRLADAAYRERAKPRKCDNPSCGPPFRRTRHNCAICGGSGVIDDGRLDDARLAILADAVEEAGCTNEDVLNSLRRRVRCMHGEDVALDERGRCVLCNDTGWRPASVPAFRGLWSLDLLRGVE